MTEVHFVENIVNFNDDLRRLLKSLEDTIENFNGVENTINIKCVLSVCHCIQCFSIDFWRCYHCFQWFLVKLWDCFQWLVVLLIFTFEGTSQRGARLLWLGPASSHLTFLNFRLGPSFCQSLSGTLFPIFSFKQMWKLYFIHSSPESWWMHPYPWPSSSFLSTSSKEFLSLLWWYVL